VTFAIVPNVDTQRQELVELGIVMHHTINSWNKPRLFWIPEHDTRTPMPRWISIATRNNLDTVAARLNV
jgi:hypothetical protein